MEACIRNLFRCWQHRRSCETKSDALAFRWPSSSRNIL
nr:unnamed protein product [Callosobruchus chinensis]